MYAFGRGVPPFSTQAVAWWRKAADQGDAKAQHNLGVMYADGRGVPEDDVEAHKWHDLAARLAPPDEQEVYAGFRDALAETMTPQQIAEAQKRAAEWQAAFEERTPQSRR